MARTRQGAALTAQHKSSQLKLRARALQDFIALWPIWEGDDRSFDRLVTATVPLVQVHHRFSAALAVAYYEAFRRAEGAGGSSTPRLLDVDQGAVVASLHVTGRVMTSNAIAAGLKPDEARKVALVRTSGAVSRHVLAGGRDSLVASVDADKAAAGYGRVVTAGACSFCRELAAKGPSVEKFRAHDHCGCAAEPAYT